MIPDLGQGGKKQPQMPQIKVDINDTTEVVCEKCGEKVFQPGFMFRRVSKILHPPDGAIIPINVFVCASCGHVPKEFEPKIG